MSHLCCVLLVLGFQSAGSEARSWGTFKADTLKSPACPSPLGPHAIVTQHSTELIFPEENL